MWLKLVSPLLLLPVLVGAPTNLLASESPTPPPGLGSGAQSSGDDTPYPVIIARVEPLFPVTTTKQKRGLVVVHGEFADDGSLSDVKVVRSDPTGVFDDAALKAISQWRYKLPSAWGSDEKRRGVEVQVLFERAPCGKLQPQKSDAYFREVVRICAQKTVVDLGQ